MQYSKINYSVDQGIGVIELADPPANTYSYAMMREIDDAVLAARMDENVHVIVLRGAGEKFFCAGADIRMLTEADLTFKYFFCLHANETLLRLVSGAASKWHSRRTSGLRARTRVRSDCRRSRSASCRGPAARSAWRGSLARPERSS
jgi:enoyl-CoA hydratase/carnithine racemase